MWVIGPYFVWVAVTCGCLFVAKFNDWNKSFKYIQELAVSYSTIMYCYSRLIFLIHVNHLRFTFIFKDSHICSTVDIFIFNDSHLYSVGDIFVSNGSHFYSTVDIFIFKDSYLYSTSNIFTFNNSLYIQRLSFSFNKLWSTELDNMALLIWSS